MNRLNYLALFLIFTGNLMAGNDQRIGQAGATQLLYNPWGVSSGLSNSNIASVRGLEAMYQNIAGAVFTQNTELGFTHSRYLAGSNIGVSNLGFVQKLGDENAIVLGVNAYSFGDIPITTTDNPEGGNGTFNISVNTINAGFSRKFSESIFGGFNLKILSMGISNLSSSGVALDAGIIYKTGFGLNKLGKKKRDNFFFGITLKNVGPTMVFSGDGLSFRGVTQNTGVTMTMENKAQDFELPTQFMLGMTYIIPLAVKTDTVSNSVKSDHTLAISANYAYNSFTRDQYSAGVEYSMKNLFQLRAGYTYEKGVYDNIETAIVYTGPTGGATVKIPMNKETGTYIGLDYSYRATRNFDGIHTIGARIIL